MAFLDGMRRGFDGELNALELEHQERLDAASTSEGWCCSCGVTEHTRCDYDPKCECIGFSCSGYCAGCRGF